MTDAIAIFLLLFLGRDDTSHSRRRGILGQRFGRYLTCLRPALGPPRIKDDFRLPSSGLDLHVDGLSPIPFYPGVVVPRSPSANGASPYQGVRHAAARSRVIDWPTGSDNIQPLIARFTPATPTFEIPVLPACAHLSNDSPSHASIPCYMEKKETTPTGIIRYKEHKKSSKESTCSSRAHRAKKKQGLHTTGSIERPTTGARGQE
ncbi:hypothetical protein HD554DRAFT_372027 [Boletus coccyginus]|nr:hypothetical protein HD554DRAFT_372027 [Boletus coccyginus]